MTDSSSPDLGALWSEVISSVDLASRAWLRRTHPIDMHGSTLMLAVADESHFNADGQDIEYRCPAMSRVITRSFR